MSLKNKPSHFNSIPAKVLKVIRKIVSPIISHIVNGSINSGIFPDYLKIAKIVPIFKSGNKYLIHNYRPISLLPLLSKIFEKVAHNQLSCYLDSKNVIFNHQYGFRSGKSPDNALVDFLKFTYDSLDDNFYVFSTFLDFKKAFDSVDHDILLNKLHHYGIRGIAHSWFKSYLSNRKQYVTIGDSSSDLLTVTHGVPQGSILGPLLFLIYINDFPQCSRFFKFILYADDSTLSCTIPKKDMLSFNDTINLHLESVSLWLSSNKIAINIEKTKYMFFSFRNSINLGDIYIGGGLISSACSTKFLGIHIDNNLNFNTHVDYISNKICKSLGIIYKLNYLPRNILFTLYQSLTPPYFNYGIISYFNLSISNSYRLSIIQKKCIRAINKLNYRDHTNDYFIGNKILKLEDQHSLHLAIYIFKTLKLNFDPILFNSLIYQDQLHDHETRFRSQLTIPRLRASMSRNGLSFKGVKLWNSLPEEFREINSLVKFKNSLKSLFFDKYCGVMP